MSERRKVEINHPYLQQQIIGFGIMRRWILELETFGFITIENSYSNNLQLLKITLNLSKFEK